jgi:hypothetical protein
MLREGRFLIKNMFLTKKQLLSKNKTIARFKFKLNGENLLQSIIDGQPYDTEFNSLIDCFKWLNRKEFKDKQIIITDFRNSDISYHYFVIGDYKYNELIKKDNLQDIDIIGGDRPNRFKFGAKLYYGGKHG